MAFPAGPLVRSMRPRQWLKNGFVYAAAIFSGRALDPSAMGLVTLAALGFCAVASASYLVNDVLDREADRSDPVKRRRPIAAGALSVRSALLAAVALFAAGLALAGVAGPRVLAVTAIYGALIVLYSLWLKLVPILEAMVLATGFLLRVVAGALAIPVVISHWLVICGFLLALLLAFGKRVPDVDHPTRRTPRYPASYLTVIVPLLAGVTLVAYTLYTVAPDTVAKIGSNALLLTVPLVLYGVLRYLLLLHEGGAQDPTVALFNDRPLLIAVLAWAVIAATVLAVAHHRLG
jgi:4-hydroxybenzoate polyprenyltransferase